MCGRYLREPTAEQIARAFKATLAFDPSQLNLTRYNIAPSQSALVVRSATRGRELAALQWGLVPPWAKDPAVGHRMINARSETLATRPAYRQAFRDRRCLVPASGFYEWARTSAGKQPHLVRLTGQELFAFAGLWEHWQSPAGSALETFTIITTDASPSLRDIHNRMPVMLSIEQAQRWVDPHADAARLEALFKAPLDDALSVSPVSRQVNSPANDTPACIEPVTVPPSQSDTLF